MRVSYEIPKSAAVSILLFCIGLYLLMAFPYSEGKLAGILLVFFSLKKIGECFLHSGLTIAVKLARTFEKRTLQDDIEDCELRIAILEDLVARRNGKKDV